MTTISLKIPDELVARMDAVARARLTNRSALLREALEEKLKAAAHKTPPLLVGTNAFDWCRELGIEAALEDAREAARMD